MGWAEQRANGTWRAGWRDDAGRIQHEDGFTRKAAATRFAGEQETRARRGELVRTPGGGATWGEWCEVWQSTRRVEANTAVAEAHRIKNHLQPRWGTVKLTKITQTDVQAWVNELDDGERAGAGVRNIYHVLSASMTAAHRRGLITTNPCRDVELPPVAEGLERYLTREEFDVVMERLDGQARVAAAVLVGTGARFSEMAGQHWHRVEDQVAGEEVVTIAETFEPPTRTIKTYPKGRKLRSVPMPDFVVAELAGRRPKRTTTCGLTHHRGGKCRSALVVPNNSGTPYQVTNFARSWHRACRAAGVDHVRPHDIRHTYASWLVQAGVPLLEVANLMGHTSVVVTQRYAHLARTQHGAVRRVLNTTS